MSLLFPRIAYAPMRCGPVRHEVAPLFSLFDDTLNELQRASRHARRQFNPRFDVKEAKDSYSLEGELPGVDQKDIAIEFTDEHTLTIKGRTERHVQSGKRPESEAKAVEAEAEATADETSSVKSHQATVEDEEPANASAVANETTNTEKVAEPESKTPIAEETKSEPEQQYWISERSVGSFSRSFNFPARVDQEAVRASLKNGILSIVIPKAPVPESRRINIE